MGGGGYEGNDSCTGGGGRGEEEQNTRLDRRGAGRHGVTSLAASPAAHGTGAPAALYRCCCIARGSLPRCRRAACGDATGSHAITRDARRGRSRLWGHVVEPRGARSGPVGLPHPGAGGWLREVSAPLGPRERWQGRARRWDCSVRALSALCHTCSARAAAAAPVIRMSCASCGGPWRTSASNVSNHPRVARARAASGLTVTHPFAPRGAPRASSAHARRWRSMVSCVPNHGAQAPQGAQRIRIREKLRSHQSTRRQRVRGDEMKRKEEGQRSSATGGGLRHIFTILFRVLIGAACRSVFPSYDLCVSSSPSSRRRSPSYRPVHLSFSLSLSPLSGASPEAVGDRRVPDPFSAPCRK